MRVDVGGHTLRAEVLGAGDPAFVCVHGLADTLEIWQPLAAPLATRGRVVLFDQRAHGDSDAPPGSYRRADLATDLRAVLDRFDVERAVLIGHSMGGIVAMTAALAYPERVAALVLIGTASQCSERVAGWYEEMACAAEADGLDGLNRAIYGANSTRQLRGDARGLAEVTRCLKSLYDDPLTLRLAAIRCPTLLLVGDKDPMGPSASAIIQKRIPGARLEVVPDRRHWLHVEAPDLVLAMIQSFLTSHVLSVDCR